MIVVNKNAYIVSKRNFYESFRQNKLIKSTLSNSLVMSHLLYTLYSMHLFNF